MTRSAHDKARELIALAGAAANDRGRGNDRGNHKDKNLADAQQSTWLQIHLQDCAACRDYAEAAGHAVRALRSQPFAADSTLVRATQMRVRSRALELRQHHERIWLVSLACLAVGISATVTTPLFWRAFEWTGAWAGVSNWVWQAGFTFCWIAPALVVGTLLLARGTHLRGTQLTSHGDNQWR
jgi:hypothetical protein